MKSLVSVISEGSFPSHEHKKPWSLYDLEKKRILTITPGWYILPCSSSRLYARCIQWQAVLIPPLCQVQPWGRVLTQPSSRCLCRSFHLWDVEFKWAQLFPVYETHKPLSSLVGRSHGLPILPDLSSNNSSWHSIPQPCHSFFIAQISIRNHFTYGLFFHNHFVMVFWLSSEEHKFHDSRIFANPICWYISSA